jgi:hypothetical protein
MRLLCPESQCVSDPNRSHDTAKTSDSLLPCSKSGRVHQNARYTRPMFSAFSAQPSKRSIPFDQLLIDFVVGWCSPAVLLVGPMVVRDLTVLAFVIFLLPAVHLTIGNWRGKSGGNLWLKALCICGAILFLAGTGKLFFLAVGLSIPPTALGIWLRRRGWLVWRMSTTANSSD